MSRRSPISRPIDVLPLAALLFSVTCWVRYRGSRSVLVQHIEIAVPPKVEKCNSFITLICIFQLAQNIASCPGSVLIGGVSALNWPAFGLRRLAAGCISACRCFSSDSSFLFLLIQLLHTHAHSHTLSISLYLDFLFLDTVHSALVCACPHLPRIVR